MLEIGPGSGVVTAFIQQLLPNQKFLSLAIDLNPYAARCARKTAEMNGVSERVEVIQGDLVESIEKRLEGAVDLLVFNPPYVPTEEPAKNRGVRR